MEKALSYNEFNRVVSQAKPGPVAGSNMEFNIYDLENFVGPNAGPIPFNRKIYYKLLLIKGHNRYNYADKSFEVDGTVLFTANPMVPYNWEALGENQSGCFCVFTEDFLKGFINIKEYPLFQPGSVPVFLLNEEDVSSVETLYRNMSAEMESNYTYKFDLIRTYVVQLVHYAMKLQPAKSSVISSINSSERITSFFLELLQRQFPVESPFEPVRVKTPADFASFLSVHVNHLNKALKSSTGKTTSQLISERTVQESRMLLRHTGWSINEIGFCLGFEDPSHFISFFKRHEKITPKQFRISKMI